jgi:hypothetical protein
MNFEYIPFLRIVQMTNARVVHSKNISRLTPPWHIQQNHGAFIVFLAVIEDYVHKKLANVSDRPIRVRTGMNPTCKPFF